MIGSGSAAMLLMLLLLLQLLLSSTFFGGQSFDLGRVELEIVRQQLMMIQK